jgi:hypothetical protein
MVIPILYGITADKAQLAISNSQSMLQKQDGIIKCQAWYLPSWRKKKLTSYQDTDENLSGQVEVRRS